MGNWLTVSYNKKEIQEIIFEKFIIWLAIILNWTLKTLFSYFSQKYKISHSCMHVDANINKEAEQPTVSREDF